MPAANSALHCPDTVIVDLGPAIREYEREVLDLATVFDTSPHEMLSWLACYLSNRECAEDEIDNAVMDAVSSTFNVDVADDAMMRFFDAALGLGLTMVQKLKESGIFMRENGDFPYAYDCLLGRSMVFRRPDGDREDYRH
jgi:hypothetical protein